ncbi:hypothetical protein OIE66_01660 [Nonomuraea sp. NBC_01738]|nr:hypothetical protein OIE66_01660 [Nonomuraea sp. NBC_01738]
MATGVEGDEAQAVPDLGGGQADPARLGAQGREEVVGHGEHGRIGRIGRQ